MAVGALGANTRRGASCTGQHRIFVPILATVQEPCLSSPEGCLESHTAAAWHAQVMVMTNSLAKGNTKQPPLTGTEVSVHVSGLSLTASKINWLLVCLCQLSVWNKSIFWNNQLKCRPYQLEGVKLIFQLAFQCSSPPLIPLVVILGFHLFHFFVYLFYFFFPLDFFQCDWCQVLACGRWRGLMAGLQAVPVKWA